MSKVYTVSKQSADLKNDKDYNLFEHDSAAFCDPSTRKPIGRICLAKGLTYTEANHMKRDLDLANGTHPLQHVTQPLLPPDAKPSTTTISTPNKISPK